MSAGLERSSSEIGGGVEAAVVLRRGADVRRRIAALDPEHDADEIARLSLVTLHGHDAFVYLLFTVAFMKQVAVPTMARILHRRGTGDILRHTAKRNDDTIVFFGQLLDHGPTSPVGRAWIERMNAIHAHFPLRHIDSLYTLSTLALDPHDLTAPFGVRLFSDAEREAQFRFWRGVAAGQRIDDLPADRHELARWADLYEQAEYAPSREGREITAALITAFGERHLPAPLRPLTPRIIAAVSSERLRQVHDLPEPGVAVRSAVTAALRAYAATVDVRRVEADRSFVSAFGDARYGARGPEEVGYQRGRRSVG